jgi:hypothetical protein
MLSLKPITYDAANQHCPGFAQSGDTLQQLGALALDFEGEDDLGKHYVLPDGLPLTKPYATANENPPQESGTMANPPFYYGYQLQVCNLSTSATAILQGVGMQIANFSPTSATSKNLGLDGVCASFFRLPNILDGGGCGGSRGGYEGFTATWPNSIGVGTSVTTALTQVPPAAPASKQVWGPLPLRIPPGYFFPLYVTMAAYPAMSGKYTFAFGFQFAGYAMTYATIQTPPVLLFQHAIEWDGYYCLNASALIAQMKMGQFYLCPKP